MQKQELHLLICAALSNVSSPKEQEHVVQSILEQASMREQSGIPKFTLTICAAGFVFCLMYFTGDDRLQGIAILGVSCTALLISYRIITSIFAKSTIHLPSVLNELKVRPRFCLSCNYDLKGSIADSCPECGIPLSPQSYDLSHKV
jgi:hypothetical protein